MVERNGHTRDTLVKMADAEGQFPVELVSGAPGCLSDASVAPHQDEVFVGAAMVTVRINDEGAYVWLNCTTPLRPKRVNAPVSCDAQPLTAREVQTLSLVAQGYSNKLIGGQLEVSENTVKTYITRIKAKLNAFDRTHAVVTAFKLGWLEI